MKTLKLLCFFIAVNSYSLSAQTFAERAAEAYLDADKNFDVDCYYSRNQKPKLISAVGETVKGLGQISRDFIIESNNLQIPMKFTLLKKDRSFEYLVLINQQHLSTGKLSKREFYLSQIEDQAFANEFETENIFCNVNFAYAYPHVLLDGNYHISVHPHKTYDWQSRLKTPIETYLNDNHFNSIILLETGNFRGNLVDINSFLNGAAYQLPPTKVDSELVVPFEVPLIVSPAGNNRFSFKATNEINVTFTGGNHNYCIWNSTRHLLGSLMNSKSEAKLNIYYDTKAIVAQAHGIERVGINFNRNDINRSNLLKDLLANKAVQASYHANYYNYFRSFLAREFSGMYKTYKINYKAQGFENSETIEGLGDRTLEVNLTYL